MGVKDDAGGMNATKMPGATASNVPPQGGDAGTQNGQFGGMNNPNNFQAGNGFFGAPNVNPISGMYPFTAITNAPGSGYSGNLTGLFGMFNGTGLTETYTKFLKNVTDSARSSLPSIEWVEVVQPGGTVLFKATDSKGTKYGYIMVLADLQQAPSQYGFPKSDGITKAMVAIKNNPTLSDINIVGSILLTSADLERIGGITSAILSALVPRCISEIGGLTIHQLAAINNGQQNPQQNNFFNMGGTQYRIDSTNVEAVRSFEEIRSPHALRPRIDYGFTLSMRRPNNGWNAAQYPNQSFNAMDDNWETIAAVGAFTDFVGPVPMGGAEKYYPVVRITSITSALPVDGMMLLLLALSAQYFIKQDMWFRPYTNVSGSSKKKSGTPNIGNLIYNAEKTDVWYAQNETDLVQFRQNYLLNPVLAVDIALGRAMITGLMQIADPNMHGRLRQTAGEFFCGAAPQTAVSQHAALEVIGSIGWNGGQHIDSRYVTYLDEVARNGQLDEAKRRLLLSYNPVNPLERETVVANLTTGFSPLYLTSVEVIAPALLEWVTLAYQNARLNISDPAVGTGMLYGTSGFGEFANFSALTNGVSPVYGNGRGFGNSFSGWGF